MLEIRPSSTRYRTKLDWLDGYHSFSFGSHNYPENVGHGKLIVLNEDCVAPGAGFDPHPHRNAEIVTWVLEGELAHRDSEGNEGIIYPGLVQKMSAGRGITHSERNNSDSAPLHLVQMWVTPSETNIDPSYEQLDVTKQLASGDLIKIASGDGADGSIEICAKNSTMYLARADEGRELEVPEAEYVHVFVASGAITLEGNRLGDGDAGRLTGHGPTTLTGTQPGEIIIWATD